jgi:hypothetical protein
MAVKVIGISDKACEETLIFKRRCQVNKKKNLIDLFIPVLYAAEKAI